MTATKTKQDQETTAAPPSAHPPARDVVSALAAVMRDLPGIGRAEKSDQGYKYRGIEQVTAEVQKLLGRYGVIFVPKVVQRQTKDLTINNKPWTEEQLTVVYTVYGPGGPEDKIEVGPIIGLGRDNSDKGTNKALTQAYKYALLQTLCIGDSKDDADRSEAVVADEVHRQSPDDRARQMGWPSDQEFKADGERFKAAYAQLSPEKKKAVTEWRESNGLKPADSPSKFHAAMGFMALGCREDVTISEAIHVGLTGELPGEYEAEAIPTPLNGDQVPGGDTAATEGPVKEEAAP